MVRRPHRRFQKMEEEVLLSIPQKHCDMGKYLLFFGSSEINAIPKPYEYPTARAEF